METAIATDALDAHDEAWQQQFILPLAEFMKARQVKHLRVDVVGEKAQFALVPEGQAVELFELVDATAEEVFHPLGLFLSLPAAVAVAEEHEPTGWDDIPDDHAVSEIRVRKVGVHGGSYTVLWRGEWHYDYEGLKWVLAEKQTGTLEKPLPLCR